VPSIKLATNDTMYRRMQDDMDINCGDVIEKDTSIEEMGEYIFNFILKVASGMKTKSEINGIGEDEFVPWVIGATM